LAQAEKTKDIHFNSNKAENYYSIAEVEDQAAVFQASMEAYIGAELYTNRMFPETCPSYMKASIKLFKVVKEKNKQRFILTDSQYFDNKDGFGFMLKNLTAGSYQIQFKKYSFGLDTFDFTTRIFAPKSIKFVDVEEHEAQRAKAKAIKKKEQVGNTKTETVTS
jgi:hypothetical protein